MDHNSVDHVWNKLQAQIDQMFGRNSSDSLNLIEYRPQHGHLLSMSQDDWKDDPEIS